MQHVSTFTCNYSRELCQERRASASIYISIFHPSSLYIGSFLEMFDIRLNFVVRIRHWQV